MKKLASAVLLLFTLVIFLSGCSFTLQVGVTKQKDEVPTNNGDFDKNVDLDGIEKELDLLSAQLSKVSDEKDIQNVLSDFVDGSSLEIVRVFYGDENGAFRSVPEMELPGDYVFKERPVYIIAVEEGKYMPELYKDIQSNRSIQSISKPVIIEGKLCGVAGMDVYID